MKRIYLAFAIALTMLIGISCFCPALAIEDPACEISGANFPGSGCDEDKTAPSVISIILNVVVGIVGIISVIFIIIGGYMYATSTGDPGKTKKAKDTILYSVIGLIVSLLSFAIINFVLSNVING